LVGLELISNKIYKHPLSLMFMEGSTTDVTREELDAFMLELEGLKSTIEILQNKEMMEQIRESERLEKGGAELMDVGV